MIHFLQTEPPLKDVIVPDSIQKAQFAEAVKKLGVLLRIAESLDRTRCGMVTGLNCDVLGDSVIMKTVVVGDATLELHDAGKANTEFKRAFRKNLEIL